MSFKTISGAVKGMGALGQLAFGQPGRWRAFDIVDDQTLVKIEAFTPSGSILGLLAVDVQNTVVSSSKFKTGDHGATEFELALNQDPGFPLVRFMRIVFWIGNKRVFGGYIWKYPGPEKKVTEPFKYSGFGLGQRLYKNKIALKLLENVYQIDSITMNGSNMTVKALSNLFTTDIIGCVAIVKGAEDPHSSGRFDIVSVPALDSIIVVNPAGVNQSIDLGTLYILPREWSVPTTLISDLVKQVVENYFSDLPIVQSTDLIEDTPDAITNAVVDLDGMEDADFLDKMRVLLPDHLIYVDDLGRVVLREKLGLIETLLIGYDAHETSEVRNDDAIVNSLTVNRKQGKETEKAGLFTSAGFAEDDDSVAEDGRSSDEADVPVFWGDDLCQAFAEASVAQTKDPKTTFTVRNMPFRRYRLGDYRWLSPPMRSETIISECQDVSEWDYDPEIITLEEDQSVKQFGAGSIRFDYGSTAVGQQVVLLTDITMTEPERLRFWFKGSRYGQRLTVGIGESSIEEHTFQLFVNSGKFKPFDINPSSLGISRLMKIGFIIEEAGEEQESGALGFTIGHPYVWPTPLPGEQLSLWVDRVSLISTAPLDRTFELVEVEYDIDLRVCHLTFGSRKESLDNFLAGQLRNLNSSKLALREL